MKYLVLGGTGTVGSEVVERLVERGLDVRVPSRSEENLDDLPEDVEGVIGDMEDPTTYRSVFDGVDRMFLLNPVSLSELHQGLCALAEARDAGVGRVVHLSVHDAEVGSDIPHFASKLAVERALENSDIDHTILRPNNFYQNDLMFRDAIVEHGLYPQPIGSVGLSRVDTRDIADAAVNALTGSGFVNEVYALVGPDVLTGEDCAEIYGEALGREVLYAGDDLEAWRAQALKALPAWMVYDFSLMYDRFQEEGLAASPAELRETREILGREPRSFELFAGEMAEAWS